VLGIAWKILDLIEFFRYDSSPASNSRTPGELEDEKRGKL
jgi:hypothetical protein